MKRFLAFLLGILILAGMIPLNGFAEEPAEVPATVLTEPAAEEPAEELPAGSPELPEEMPAEEESAEEEPAEAPAEEPAETPADETAEEIPAEEAPADETAEEIPAEETAEEELPLPGNGDAEEKAPSILTAKNFPDDALRVCLIDEFGSSLTAEEAAEVSSLEFYEKGIRDLTGIREFFTGLDSLELYDADLKTIDLHGMKDLAYLWISDCNTEELILTGCDDLKLLSYYHNPACGIVGLPASVTSLTLSACNLSSVPDLSGLEDLTVLDLSCNSITKFDPGRLTSLTRLDLSWNGLTALDVSRLTRLTYLSVGNNKLTKLDVQKNTALSSLDCEGNRIKLLDLIGHAELKNLHCSGNGMQELRLIGCTHMVNLDCSDNKLTHLDLAEMSDLSQLSAGGNRIDFISFLYQDEDLSYLDLSNNLFGSMRDLRYLPGHILDLKIGSNPRWKEKELDLSEFGTLELIDCSDLGLTSLTVPKANLMYLYATGNRLTSLDLKGASKLISAYLQNNDLISLNVTGCEDLTYLIVYGNRLGSITGVSALENLYELDLGEDEDNGEYQRSDSAVLFWHIGGKYYYCPEESDGIDYCIVYGASDHGSWYYANEIVVMDQVPEYVYLCRHMSACGTSVYYLVKIAARTEEITFYPGNDYLAIQKGDSVILSCYLPKWIDTDQNRWIFTPGILYRVGSAISLPSDKIGTYDVSLWLDLPGLGDEAVRTLRVDVTDGATGVRLTDTKVTVDLGSSAPAVIGIMPILPELTKDGTQAITSARFTDPDLRRWFSLEPDGDRGLRLLLNDAKADALYDGTLLLPKGAMKSSVEVTCFGKTYTTQETVSVTIKATLPSFKGKSVSLNSCTRLRSAPVTITGAKLRRIRTVSEPDWLSFDADTMRVTYTGEAGKRLSGKLVLACYAEGADLPKQVSISVSAKPTAPKLTINKKSLTLVSGMNDCASVTIKLNSAWADQADRVWVETNNLFRVTSDYDPGSEDDCLIDLKSADPVKGTVSYAIISGGLDPRVSGKVRFTFHLGDASTVLTVTLKPAAKAMVGMTLKTGGSINLQVPGCGMRIIPSFVGIKPLNHAYIDPYGNKSLLSGYLYDITVDKITESGTNADVTNRFRINPYQVGDPAWSPVEYAYGPWIQLSLKEGCTLDPSRSYTATVTAKPTDLNDEEWYYGHAQQRPVYKQTIGIPVIDQPVKVSVKVKKSGSFSATDRNCAIVLIPTFTNAPRAYAGDLGWKVIRTYDAAGKRMISEDVSSMFERDTDSEQAVVLRPIDIFGLMAGDKYTIRLYYGGKECCSTNITLASGNLLPEHTSGAMYRDDQYSSVDLGDLKGIDPIIVYYLYNEGMFKLDKTSAKWFRVNWNDSRGRVELVWKDGLPAEAAKWKSGTVKTVTLTMKWPSGVTKSCKLKITIK